MQDVVEGRAVEAPAVRHRASPAPQAVGFDLEKAMSLRVAGIADGKIAKAMGVPLQELRRGIQAALDREAQSLTTEQRRALENVRIDALQAKLWALVEKGALGGGAMQQLIKLMQHRATINGLREVKLTIEDGNDREQLARELAGYLAQPAEVGTAGDS